MVSRMLLVAFLGLSLVSTSFLVSPPSVLADDDNLESTPGEGEDPTFDDGTVNGTVYKIEQREGAHVVTVYDRDVGMSGLGIDVYVRTPGLVSMITSGTVCIGRYVVFEGVRTSPKTLDAEGVWVDMSTGCHEPPK